MIRITLRSAAWRDLERAMTWYENQRAGLAREFLDEIEATLRKVATAPQLFRVVKHAIRRAGVRRFPYGVYFVIDPDGVGVIAIFHAKRDPRTIAGRA